MKNTEESKKKELKVCEATKNDVKKIANFQLQLAKESEDIALDLKTVMKGVETIMSKEDYGKYIVVRDNDVCVACLLITFEYSDWRNCRTFWIQSVYVDADYRRQGIFTNMYKYVEKWCKEEGGTGLRLYVEHDNDAALKTYEKLGMKKDRYYLMEKLLGEF